MYSSNRAQHTGRSVSTGSWTPREKRIFHFHFLNFWLQENLCDSERAQLRWHLSSSPGDTSLSVEPYLRRCSSVHGKIKRYSKYEKVLSLKHVCEIARRQPPPGAGAHVITNPHPSRTHNNHKRATISTSIPNRGSCFLKSPQDASTVVKLLKYFCSCLLAYLLHHTCAPIALAAGGWHVRVDWLLRCAAGDVAPRVSSGLSPAAPNISFLMDSTL
jgi:hypothetical protein